MIWVGRTREELEAHAATNPGYRVMLIDPPWQYYSWTSRGEGKGAAQHYGCMDTKDICELPIGKLAGPDCAIFMWVVQPKLREAFDVLDAWGFAYKTVAFYWVKMPRTWSEDRQGLLVEQPRLRPRLSLGFHTRSGAEQCWLAVRGDGYDREQRNKGVEQVLHAAVREHSRKPDEIYERIEELVGDASKIEVFARKRRFGWSAFGNEATARAYGGEEGATEEANP